jgi:hypothetical protein
LKMNEMTSVSTATGVVDTITVGFT